jgi:hypothetical protein
MKKLSVVLVPSLLFDPMPERVHTLGKLATLFIHLGANIYYIHIKKDVSKKKASCTQGCAYQLKIVNSVQILDKKKITTNEHIMIHH